MMDQSFKRGLNAGIPIGLGYFAVSFTFGIAAVKGGLAIHEAVLISLLCLTSAGQFAGIGVIFEGGGLIEMAVTQLIINLRYSLMSFTVSQKLGKDVGTGERMVVAFGVTDEIFGVTAAQRGKVSPKFCYGAMALSIPGWTLGTLAGAVSGTLLPPFVLSALGVAIYGMFMAIIIPPAKKQKQILGVIVAAALLSALFRYAPYLSGISEGFAIIIVTAAVSVAFALLFPRRKEAGDA